MKDVIYGETMMGEGHGEVSTVFFLFYESITTLEVHSGFLCL